MTANKVSATVHEASIAVNKIVPRNTLLPTWPIESEGPAKIQLKCPLGRTRTAQNHSLSARLAKRIRNPRWQSSHTCP